MPRTSNPSTLEAVRERLRSLVAEKRIGGAPISVLAKPLSPEEAIGTPGRRDFPILVGRERVVEATVLGARGHAFTDSPREFTGTMTEVLGLELHSNQNRAIFVAVLNAALRALALAQGTVHCKDDDPEQCARQVAATLLEKHGRVSVGLIGLNPAIAERLVETCGTDNVRLLDLDPKNVGQRRFGVEVWDGKSRTEDLISASQVLVLTGTTLVNGTFDDIWELIRSRGKTGYIYGVTAAGVCALNGWPRLCFCGR